MPGEGETRDTKKHFAVEDIRSAADVGGTLEAYRGAAKERRDFSDLVELQNAVAEKMHELGDEDKSSQFTILAGQTETTARMSKVADVLGEVESGMNRDALRFYDGVKGFDRSSDRVNTAAESISGSLDRNISKFVDAAGKVESASGKIDESSKTMIEASNRIRGSVGQ
jgi:hypothetical protein